MDSLMVPAMGFIMALVIGVFGFLQDKKAAKDREKYSPHFGKDKPSRA